MNQSFQAKDRECLEHVLTHTLDTVSRPSSKLLPDENTLDRAHASLLTELPEKGLEIETALDHLLQDISPALNQSSLSPNYYGFVTGGVTPAARIGEAIVSLYDQNVAVHLPDETLATAVEDKALKLLKDLVYLEHDQWHGLFTTGATASNIVGLALAREYVINNAIEKATGDPEGFNTVRSLGILRACRLAGLEDIDIFTTRPHSSLVKAASIVGLGRDSVVNVGSEDCGVAFDLERLEELMLERCNKHAFIVVVSCGEVNTGLYATNRWEDMSLLRSICNRYGAWIHVDAAFGIFARVLGGVPGFERISDAIAGIEMADSIAGDAHKLLNVPYDCGYLFSRVDAGPVEQVFQNANAAYLKAADSASTNNIRSPLNVGLENSRRFRALPVYTSLMAYGREGYKNMLVRQVQLARAVAGYLFHHRAFELLPSRPGTAWEDTEQTIFIIVLFRAKDDRLNESLVKRINGTSVIYCSGTSWEDRPATRFAVSNWQAGPLRDLGLVHRALETVLREWEAEQVY